MKQLDHYYSQLLDRYGSRRGILRTYWHRVKYSFGAYRRYRKIDWNNIDRLVFICKGNICRSAFAERVAKSLGVDAISCGVSTQIDYPANADAIKAAERRGVDLGSHRTTPIMYAILRKTDLIIAMEPWHAHTLTTNLKRKHSITLLGLWAAPLRPHIQDPYGFSEICFDNCFDYIESSVNEITKKIKN